MIQAFTRSALLLLAIAGCADGSTGPDPEALSVEEQDVTVDEVLARAQQWVDLQVPYCGGVNGGTDYICGGICERAHAAWDDFRTDCSGFVSWAWQIPDDPTSDAYTVDRAGPDGWSTISIDSLAAGDAVTTNGHIKLFSRFVSSNAAEILEEYDCGEVAHRAVQNFTRSGNTLYFSGDGRSYHPIRRHSLTETQPPVQDRVAFEANTGELWTGATTSIGPAHLGMMHGTSPSIVALSGGGYEVAFQANTGELWTTGTAGTTNWHLGMQSGTNPSITALPNNGYEVAFQANTSSLWTAGTAGTHNWGLGMDAASSPSITALSSGGYEIAFQANTHNLWTASSSNFAGNDASLGMMHGTSPSITALPDNGYEVAFQANTSSLWTTGTAGSHNWNLGMDALSSPSIAAVSGGGYAIAFQANTHSLWFATSSNFSGRNASLGMHAGTSPAISHADPSHAYFQANTGNLWSSASGAFQLGMNNSTSPSGT